VLFCWYLYPVVDRVDRLSRSYLSTSTYALLAYNALYTVDQVDSHIAVCKYVYSHSIFTSSSTLIQLYVCMCVSVCVSQNQLDTLWTNPWWQNFRASLIRTVDSFSLRRCTSLAVSCDLYLFI